MRSTTPLPATIIAALVLALVVGGCAMPRVHRVNVQQGNLVSQQMIDRLKPGMTRSQVAFVLGEPIYKNSFADQRWDYLYTLDIPNVLEQRRILSVFFANGVLAYFTGDYAPSSATAEEDEDAGPTVQPTQSADEEDADRADVL